MTEYVFRRCRRVDGKRVVSRWWSGRYTVSEGEPRITVALHTADRDVAKARLRRIVVDAQREREGLIPARSLREGAATPLVELIGEYAADLRARGLAVKHVHDTVTRLERVVRETEWQKLRDVHAQAFVRWRATLGCSAKTKKEYQISLNAFLNWLLKTERLGANPLAKVDRVETRGKQVRPYRAFTFEELRRLFAAVSNERRLAYRMLLYTGQRRSEIAALVLEDLTLTAPASVRIRLETTKDKDSRSIPLHPMLADELRRAFSAKAAPSDLVFPNFPSYDALRADLKRADIERRDALGRVVHFHSFRKTCNTWLVKAGVSQRVAQELLGHSDPALTANVYTDVPAVGMHDEIAKLPWVGGAPGRAPEMPKADVFEQFRKTLGNLVELAKAVVPEGNVVPALAATGTENWLPGLGSNQRPSD